MFFAPIFHTSIRGGADKVYGHNGHVLDAYSFIQRHGDCGKYKNTSFDLVNFLNALRAIQ